ncbi:unnamed protein product [Lampetra planeri]
MEAIHGRADESHTKQGRPSTARDEERRTAQGGSRRRRRRESGGDTRQSLLVVVLRTAKGSLRCCYHRCWCWRWLGQPRAETGANERRRGCACSSSSGGSDVSASPGLAARGTRVIRRILHGLRGRGAALRQSRSLPRRMFRSRRLALVHRLWRSRAMGCEETAAAAAAGNDAAAVAATEDNVTAASSNSINSGSSSSGEDDGPCRGRFCLCRSREPPSEMKALATGLLKQLSVAQLESLAAAAESRGSAESGCVPLPNGDLVLGAQRVSTLLFVCRLLRWPDLRHPLELKRLCSCESFGRAGHQQQQGLETLCCNPFHLSRLCMPDSPPPPYTRFPPESPKLQVGGGAPFPTVETSSTEFHWMPGLRGTFLPPDVHKSKPWCTLAYWEHKTRAGPLFHAYEQAVSVFYELPQSGDGATACTAAASTAATRGLCLKQLPGTNGGSQTVRRTRARVGSGLLLSREPDGVWAYNRGEQPAFVHSPTLDAPGCSAPGGSGGRAQALCRVPSGHSVKVFDFEHARHLHKLSRADDGGAGDRPRDIYSVRISFGKGWGRDYSRQCVLDCPCWLEVFFYR